VQREIVRKSRFANALYDLEMSGIIRCSESSKHGETLTVTNKITVWLGGWLWDDWTWTSRHLLACPPSALPLPSLCRHSAVTLPVINSSHIYIPSILS
jgi:hypothetical protein